MKVKLLEKQQFKIAELNKDIQYVVIDTKDIFSYQENFGWRLYNSKVLNETSWYNLVNFMLKHGKIDKSSKFDLSRLLSEDPSSNYFVDSI